MLLFLLTQRVRALYIVSKNDTDVAH